ncbi:MAG: 4,5-DOPA dioxygenase extradiol [Burkholderiales bacterium 66-5]|nr:MAG: 4,5-DOPA dioxygenase extradiol [Burkholderiales bacterium 66-5]
MIDTAVSPQTSALAQVFVPSARMPVLFVGHGSPMNAIEHNVWRQTWQDLGQELLARAPRPQLILCISAHWLTRGGWWLTGMAEPRTIHDFGGFPRELFEQQYPAPGAPQAAHALVQLLRSPATGGALQVDEGEWGLDHGAWSVLKPMFPAADIPVMQLSMDYDRPASEHLALGRQLAVLRDFGVLIVGSGNTVHNLRAMRPEAGINATYTWANAFDTRVAQAVEQGDAQALADFQQWGEIAQLSHPSYDHYLPLLYAMGAVQKGEQLRFFNTGFQKAAIAMRSMLWGLPG